jgi:hypothetical protein
MGEQAQAAGARMGEQAQAAGARMGEQAQAAGARMGEQPVLVCSERGARAAGACRGARGASERAYSIAAHVGTAASLERPPSSLRESPSLGPSLGLRQARASEERRPASDEGRVAEAPYGADQ